MTFIIILASASVLIILASYICYRMAFVVNKKQSSDPYHYIKDMNNYPHKDRVIKLINDVLEIPCEECETDSFDGLKLHARLYEKDKSAPVLILMHGYSSNARGDFSGGLQLDLKYGCNVILPDQRAHNKSEGRCLTFGVLERQDVLSWIEYAVNHFGKDCSIVLVGISMGAATVLMASDLDLPSNVKGIIADCGYSSPPAIIKKVIKDLHYPFFTYSLVRTGGLLFGGFDIESSSAVESLKKCKVPVLFIHGECDDFVPCDMSRTNYSSCSSEKLLEIFPDAGHGLSYVEDTQRYERIVRDFLDHVFSRT